MRRSPPPPEGRSTAAGSSGMTTVGSGPSEPLTGTPGALVLIADVACPWATVMVLRLRAARDELGLASSVPVIHLAHPLELLYEQPIARRVLDAEIPVCASTTPDFGWSLWQGRLDEYPVSSLLAIEAVQAARRQSEDAAEELDLALRRALFVRSRCISLRHEVLAAARDCPTLDVDRLASDLDRGVARAAVSRQATGARSVAATCTGYLVLPDGTGWCNAGIATSWVGPPLPRGVPLVQHDDPGIYRELVTRAAATAEPKPTSPRCPM